MSRISDHHRSHRPRCYYRCEIRPLEWLTGVADGRYWDDAPIPPRDRANISVIVVDIERI